MKIISIIVVALIGLIPNHAFAIEGGKVTIKGEATVARGRIILYLGSVGRNTQAHSDFTDRNFVIETKMDKPEFLIFFTTDPILKNFNLYLKPGDDISIAVKGKKIMLSGEGSALNQFYLDMSMQYSFKDPKHSDREAYTNRIKAINTSTVPEVKKNKKLLIGHTQGEYLNAVFGDYIQAKIVPSADPLPKVQFDDRGLEFMPELSTYYDWSLLLNEMIYTQIESGKLKIRNSKNWVADFANTISDQTLKEAYIVELINLILQDNDLTMINDFAKQALPLVKDKANIAKINAILQKADENTLFKNAIPGTDFSKAKFQKPDGTQVSISDYKGKLVFIDIWATWCAPCIAEMPFLKRIEHGMEGDDIVFLSVSGDKIETSWQNFLTKNNSTGEQLWMPDGTSNPFFSQIGSSGIPRFLILDKAGKMLNPKCYLRPSNPVLSIYLKELVKK